jgi:hypothetical protein
MIKMWFFSILPALYNYFISSFVISTFTVKNYFPNTWGKNISHVIFVVNSKNSDSMIQLLSYKRISKCHIMFVRMNHVFKKDSRFSNI